MLYEAESEELMVFYNPLLFSCGYDIDNDKSTALISILDAIFFVLMPTIVIVVATLWLLLKIRRLHGIQRQGVITVLVVSLVFVISLAPWNVLILYWLPAALSATSDDPDDEPVDELANQGDAYVPYRVAIFMSYLNFAANPIIYYVTIRSFNRFVRRMMLRMLGQKNRAIDSTTNPTPPCNNSNPSNNPTGSNSIV